MRRRTADIDCRPAAQVLTGLATVASTPLARIARQHDSLPNADALAGFLESPAACLPSVACSAIGGKCCTCAAFTLDTRHSAHRSQAIARPSCWRQRPNTPNQRRRLWRSDGTLLGPFENPR